MMINLARERKSVKAPSSMKDILKQVLKSFVDISLDSKTFIFYNLQYAILMLKYIITSDQPIFKYIILHITIHFIH